MDVEPSTQWLLPSADDLLWEQWEEDYTVFDRKTRETHLINELPAEILRLLSTRPATTEEITARLAQLCELANTPEWAEKIASVIDNLSSLGLIERHRQ